MACRLGRWGLIGALLTGLLALGCAPKATRPSAALPSAQTVPPRAELVCANSTTELQRVWSAEARSAVRRAVVAAPEGGGEASAERVVKELDALAERWQLAHDQNCNAPPEDPQARLARAQIERCLDDELVALGTLSEALAGADAELLSHVREAFAIVSENGTACTRPPIYGFYGDAAESSANQGARRDLARAAVLFRLERKQAAEAAFSRARAAAKSGEVRLQVLITLSEGTRLNGARQFAQAAQQAELATQRARSAGYIAGQAEAAALHAFIARDRAKHQAELEWLQQALPWYRAAFGEDSLRTSAIFDHSGSAYFALEQFDDALGWFRKALAARKHWSPDHPVVLEVENHIAAARRWSGAFAEAAQGYQAVLTSGAGDALSREQIADAYVGLGDTLLDQGKADDALAALNQALALQTRLGSEGEKMAIVFNSIALVHQHKSEFDAALTGFQQALAILERKYGKDHEQLGKISMNVGVLYQQRGNYQMALEWHQRALEIFMRVHGSSHSLTGSAYNNIGLVQLDLRQYAEAIRSLEKAKEIKEDTLGRQHPSTANTYGNLGMAYADIGQYPQAIEYDKKALEIEERVLGKEHATVAGTYNNIGNAEQGQQHFQEALLWYEKALAIKERTLGANNPSTANTYNNIGMVQFQLSNFDAASASLRKALAIRERVLGKDHPATLRSYESLGGMEAERGRYGEALKWYGIALEINRRVHGDDDAATRKTLQQIAEVERLKKTKR